MLKNLLNQGETMIPLGGVLKILSIRAFLIRPNTFGLLVIRYSLSI
jgi:hypothetical protein